MFQFSHIHQMHHVKLKTLCPLESAVYINQEQNQQKLSSKQGLNLSTNSLQPHLQNYADTL